MVSVASLLNPLPPAFERYGDCASLASSRRTSVSPPSFPTSKKLKMSKAAATFVKAKPKGVINFKPYEYQDDIIAAEHERFEVEPIGHITDYPRHIPYNSEKKSFQQKTGRDAFEAYHYTFRMPDDDRGRDPHAVMWDYNVGLVRITSFFKSLKHTKTMPAKVMSANPGLKEISHSITGGSIGAQGYWVPFEAAKAIAATFCYEIRYALTPVFGVDFPGLCVVPDDPMFQRTSIDRDIISRCTEAAHAHRAQSQESSLADSPRSAHSTFCLQPLTTKSLRPKTSKVFYAESGYCTDTDRSSVLNSPSSGSIEWTTVNTPTIPRSDPFTRPDFGNFRFPSPSPPNSKDSDGESSDISSSKERKPLKRVRLVESGVTDGRNSENDSSVVHQSQAKRRKISTTLTQEARAAYTLMQLHMADAALAQRKGPKPRRASR